MLQFTFMAQKVWQKIDLCCLFAILLSSWFSNELPKASGAPNACYKSDGLLNTKAKIDANDEPDACAGLDNNNCFTMFTNDDTAHEKFAFGCGDCTGTQANGFKAKYTDLLCDVCATAAANCNAKAAGMKTDPSKKRSDVSDTGKYTVCPYYSGAVQSSAAYATVDIYCKGSGTNNCGSGVWWDTKTKNKIAYIGCMKDCKSMAAKGETADGNAATCTACSGSATCQPGAAARGTTTNRIATGSTGTVTESTETIARSEHTDGQTAKATSAPNHAQPMMAGISAKYLFIWVAATLLIPQPGLLTT